MWKGTTATELPKTTAPAATAKPVTEDELRGIVDRLEATRDIFRENQELRSVLAGREGETRALRTRNTELEEIMRQFAPTLSSMAATMVLEASLQQEAQATAKGILTFVGMHKQRGKE